MMNCPYGSKFDAYICTMRYNVATEADCDESHCAFSACAECNAVKCYIEYRRRKFEKNKKYLVEEKKALERKKKLTWKDENGRTVIAIGIKNYQPEYTKLISPNVDSYIYERFVQTYFIIKENNIKSYEELLNFVHYKSMKSIYIYIRDNRDGLEILFKHHLQE